MRKAIIDTDTLSEIFKEQNAIVTAKAEAYLEYYDRLTYISVTASEFLYGFYVKDARKQIIQAITFLKANEELVPTSEDYWLLAEINAGLKRIGRPIGNGDPMIAAYAINRDMILVTGNMRHYQYVIEAGFSLQLVNWKLE